MPNNTFQRRQRSAVFMVSLNTVRGPAERERLGRTDVILGSRTAIMTHQNQHVSRDRHLSEPCEACREPQETKGTERKKHHEEERVSERKVSIPDDRREDQGAGRLAGQDALSAPHMDQ